MDSILTSIKKLLGIAEDYTHFDAALIMHINSVFAVLKQLGVGPSEGFRINSDAQTWGDFADGSIDLEPVKDYIFLKVKTIFDPPTSSFVMEANKEMIKELEWRLNVANDEEV